VNDGNADSNLATVSITVTSVNDLPVITALADPVSGAAPLEVAFTAVGTDVDGDTLSYSWTFGDGGTSVEQNPNHTYGSDGSYTAAVTVSDGRGGSASDSVAITVQTGGHQGGLEAEFFDWGATMQKIPDLTGVTPDVTRIDEVIDYPSTSAPWTGLGSEFADTFVSRHSGYLKVETSGDYTLYINSDDGSKLYLDGGLLIDNDGGHGMVEKFAALALAVGYHELRVEFFENGGGAGLIMSWAGPGIAKQVIPAGVLYVFDAEGASDSASVTITVASNTAPVAESMTVSTSEDTAAGVALQATDAQGDALTYTVITQPAHGVLSGTAPALSYSPDADYHGTDGFTWKASDGKLDSNTAVISLNVIPVNDAPTANDQAVSTGAGSSVDITLTAADIDGDALTYAIVDLPANGAIAGDDGDRNVTYTPNAGFSGEDMFTFVADDGMAASDTATVTVSVSAGNLVEIMSVSTGQPYSLATAEVGALYYIDRSYVIDGISANLDRMVLVRTANADKRVSTENHLTLRVGETATVSVCYDKRATLLPDWLADGTWTLTDEVMSVTDKQASPLVIYEKTVDAGEITLGGNLAAGAYGTKSNYVVVVRPAGAAAKIGAGKSETELNSVPIFVEGPIPPDVWISDGDADGDGLLDDFETLYGVDPSTVDTDENGETDETEVGPDGRSLWDIQQEWDGVIDPGDGSDGSSGGGGGGGCFIGVTSR